MSSCASVFRGLDATGLQSVLQALCLRTHSSFDIIEHLVLPSLQLLPDLRLSEAVRLLSQCDMSGS